MYGGSIRYEGVFWDVNCQLWRASIDVRGKPKFLGVFATDFTAADARRRAQQKEHERGQSVTNYSSKWHTIRI